MRAAKMKERPSFQLMVQTDVQSIYHMQMPRWLFSDTRYCEMSLDAKVTYTFLLNRFQLSRRNGWVNERGEVFVIFPRKALAKELRICEQRVTAAFKKLVELELVWEKRCGRGDANQIYLAYVTPQDDPNYVSISQPACGSGKVLLYRTVRHSRDYKGGYNHFITRHELEKWSYTHLLDALCALRKDWESDEQAA